MLCFYWVLITIFCSYIPKGTGCWCKDSKQDPTNSKLGLPLCSSFAAASSKIHILPQNYPQEVRPCEKEQRGMKENRNYTKAALLFPNYPWNRGKRNTDFRIFFLLAGPSAAICNRQTPVEWKTIQLKGKCCVWGAPPDHHPSSQAGIQTPGRTQPQPLHAGKEVLGKPWWEGEKGVSKWDRHTWSNRFTEVPFTGFLVENQVLCMFRHDTSTPKQNQSPLINWWSFPHTSCPFLEELESRWASDFIHKWVHTPRGLFSILSIPDASQHFLHNSS